MSVDDTITRRVRERLVRDYKLRESGTYLRQGECPECGKKELYAAKDKPRVLRCGRLNKCGFEADVRDLYPDIFADWSEITLNDPSPTAAADAYLSHARHLDLLGFRDAYAQEYYQDRDRNIGSATVRFPIGASGAWWERLIDRPERFGERKANFSPRGRDGTGPSYQGHVWTYPGHDLAQLAAADQIWLVEGIFDAAALEQGDFRAARDPDHPIHRKAEADPTTGTAARDAVPVEDCRAVSLMTCNNWPEHFLTELRKAIADGATPTKSPSLVFALDVGKAGAEWTRTFVARAREEGWKAVAAHVRLDDEPGAKLDWNDLHVRGRLGHVARAAYRWHGDVLVAADEREKAILIWERKGALNFSLVHETRTYWVAMPTAQKVEEETLKAIEDESIKGDTRKDVQDAIVRRLMSVSLIANCSFRALYFERDEATDTSAYWLRIDRPGKWARVKASFPGGAVAKSGGFKDRLASVVSGAIWTGEQFHLDRIMQRQLPVREVTGIEFTGYCREHKVYVLGDIAVARGKVYRPNDDGFFDIGKAAIKLRTSERILDALTYDPDKLDTAWLDDFWTAWGPKGVVVLAFMAGLALVAEQVRGSQKSLGFLELTGLPGAGKSTIVEFIWKLLGRAGYEGFDANKSTQAGIARELAKAANLPIVFIEGDRNEEAGPSKNKFDWDETKTLFNGRATRTRGVASSGLETYSPPFRGAFAIVQNDPVNASRAVLERIMSVHFDKTGWTPETKAAAERIENWPIENVAGYIVHAARREAQLLERFHDRFAAHEAELLALPGVANGRLAKNHAQLLAMLDALPIVLPGLRPEWLREARTFVATMAVDRHKAVASEHPDVETFWDRFEYLESIDSSAAPLNHARDANLIAIRLAEFETRCANARLSIAPIGVLRKLLRQSRRYPFVDAKTVNSGREGVGSVACFVFQRPLVPNHPSTR